MSNIERNLIPNSEAGKPVQPIEITSATGRVRLKQYTPADAEEGFALIDKNREHLSQFGDRTAAKYQTIDDFRDSIMHPNNPQRLRFGIRRDGQLVGTINLTPDEDNSKRGEIGYYLGAEFQRQGNMRAAVELLSDFAFMNLDYEELYAEVVDGNTASMSVLKKARYTFEEKRGDKLIMVKHKPKLRDDSRRQPESAHAVDQAYGLIHSNSAYGENNTNSGE
ncbi:MAG TPA: GNAT family N-acetyltransferase [Patescibacteria group bacterium]|nr:GNAT family N-acetyltransferase [Patescibacteria group bacterium]